MDTQQKKQFLSASNAAEQCCDGAAGLKVLLSYMNPTKNILLPAIRRSANELCESIKKARPVFDFVDTINETYSSPEPIVTAWGRD